MTEQLNDINKIIARVLSKEAGVNDILLLNNWLNQSPENMSGFLVLKDFWEIQPETNETYTAEESFNKYQERLSEEKTTKKSRKVPLFISIAASIAVLIGISFFYFTQQKAVEYYTYIAQNDICDFVLEDGTKISLNKNSKLTYSNDFGKKERLVKLEGEAYFDVAKNKEKTFIVELGSAQVKVLGTKFNVKANVGDNQLTATLEEGSIRFESGKHRVILQPNQQLTFNRTTQSIGLEEVHAEVFTAWKDKIYRYQSITINDLSAELEKIYGCKIIIKKQWGEVKVSGSFLYEQNIEDVLRIMQSSVHFKWYKEGNIITIQ